MYNDYWGFSRNPFDGRLDPEKFYESPSHEEALARLSYVVEQGRQGALLLGPAGTGKSLLLESFVQTSRSEEREIAVARAPGFGGRNLFFELAQELGIPLAREANSAEIWRLIRDRVSSNRTEGTQTVLIVDQAHLLIDDPEHIRDVHMLFHLDPHPETKLSVVLSARSEFLEKARAEIVEWVDLGVSLEPLSETQTGEYIRHLLHWSGNSDEIFTQGAVHKIQELTGGIPRQINRVCDLSLLAASSDGQRHIHEDLIESVYQELSPDATVVAAAG